MLIYNDIFRWKGWGGKLSLASGSCSLRIFDQRGEKSGDLLLLRPIIVVVSDVPGNDMSIRSCSGHIATMVTQEFGINPQRMMWIEYYPATDYGKKVVRSIPEKFDVVEFVWKEEKAIEPKWRPLKPPMLEPIKKLLETV